MASQHALLSPSSAHIWLNCPPAARLAAQYGDAGSTFAQQGTDAHELCQHKLEKALGIPTEDPREHLAYYDAEMERCSDDYDTFCENGREKCKKKNRHRVPVYCWGRGPVAKSMLL